MASDALTSADTIRRLRRRNRVYYSLGLAATAVGGAIMAPDPFGAVAAIPSLLLACLLIAHPWTRTVDGVLMGATILVGIVTLVATAALQDSVSGSTGLAVALGLWISRRPGYRKTLVLLATVAISAVSCVALLTNTDRAPFTLVALCTMALVWLYSVIDVEDQFRLVRALERAKDAEAETSVLRERARIAADLHDIQGHTLHVIKLKAAVAARVQHTDPARTAEELAAIQKLLAESIDQGRRLVNDRHELSLAAELSNATELLEAAGISVEVVGAERVAAEWQATAAQVLREATTNILRHSRATRVEIGVQPRGIAIRNDGVEHPPAPHRGLARLRDRLVETDGTFSAGVVGGALGPEGSAGGCGLRFEVRAANGWIGREAVAA